MSRAGEFVVAAGREVMRSHFGAEAEFPMSSQGIP